MSDAHLTDPPWVALDRAIRLLNASAYRILKVQSPSDEQGLNADEINRLTRECGLTDRDIIEFDGKHLRIRHPVRPDVAEHQIQGGWCPPLNSAMVADFLDYLEAWRDLAKTRLAEETDGNSGNSFKLFPRGKPKNQDVVNLVVELHIEKTKPEDERRSDAEIARDFVSDPKKANSLLKQVYNLRREGRVNY